MMVPDSSMIAEINLFGEGFQETRVLARKVIIDPTSVRINLPIEIVEYFEIKKKVLRRSSHCIPWHNNN